MTIKIDNRSSLLNATCDYSRAQIMPDDWNIQEIKAELVRLGLSLSGVSSAAGLHRSAGSVALRKRFPAAERAIATALNKRPEDIWPSRYPSSDTPSARGESSP